MIKSDDGPIYSLIHSNEVSESAFKLFDFSSEESKTTMGWRPTEPDGGASTRIEQAAVFTRTIASQQMSGVIA